MTAKGEGEEAGFLSMCLDKAGKIPRMCRIEFHAPAAAFDRIPHPTPASRHVPDWFKQMPTDYSDGGTLKRCPPFLEAMTAGYIIPLPDDLGLEVDSTGQFQAYSPRPVVSGHFPDQYKGSPFESQHVFSNSTIPGSLSRRPNMSA